MISTHQGEIARRFAMTDMLISSQAPSLPQHRIVGVLAALGVVVIWSAWIVGTRHAATGRLDLCAVGFLRFAIPAAVFAPVWLRTGLLPRGVSLHTLIALMGSGAPFFMVAATATRYTPAAEIGPLLTGTMPLMATGLACIVLRERMSRFRVIGAIQIAIGIGAIGLSGLSNGFHNSLAQGALLLGAAMWAIYTIAFKESALSPISAAAVISVLSAIVLAPFGLPPLVSAFEAGLATQVLAQATLQGLLSGVVAVILYGIAIRSLGVAGGSAFIALVPATAALLAIPMLGEYPTGTDAIAMAITAMGVLFMNVTPAFDRPAFRTGAR
jgi:drug/metabolite transporter (DMT)-like permease